MTRKRFVKLLMADGYSRNEANTLAAYARSYGYSKVYKAELVMRAAKIKLNNIDITAVCDAIRNIAEVVQKAASAFAKAAVAFAKTYTAEMEANNE